MLQGVRESRKLKFFSRVASSILHKEIIKLQQAHTSWNSFQMAFLKEFRYKDMPRASYYEFDKWVTLKK